MSSLIENFFMTDLKIYDSRLNSSTHLASSSLDKTMERYQNKIGDYENDILVESVFSRLGWSYKYSDTIWSFLRAWYAVAVYMSNDKKWTYEGVLPNCNELLYRFDHENHFRYCHWNGLKGKNSGYKSAIFPKNKIGEKYSDKNTIHHKKSRDMVHVYAELEKLAALTDSICNFMPHPGYPFNQLKGTSPDVYDCLPLMIDKIQASIDETRYSSSRHNDTILNLEKWEDWKLWFIKNRETYCLEDFYEYDSVTGKIKGCPFFKKQSLNYPYPKTSDEISECLNTYISKLERRAKKMNEKFA